ncbi:hypothetical protein Acr_15g0008730 [Actinidia rufa]|uniref:Bulb-type lectin domain-containing protein n=1 Tax=Actinidia rufa TaxID=165716 RepID=A0A7J0FU87_9ERIC|nr:hypothetical protein Acr_15g0008730 [Actinidia rufa]
MPFSKLQGRAVNWAEAEAPGLISLRFGNSISVEKQSEFLISPNGTFASGFYQVAAGTNAYCYSIWITNSVTKTVVWMANRDRPVIGKRSKLTLHRNGNVLVDPDGSTMWSSYTVSEAYAKVRLLETGDLVLIDQRENVIWEFRLSH